MSHSLRTSVYTTVFLLSAAGILQGAGNGLKGEYFNNTGLLGSPVMVRTDATVGFDWGSAGPGSGISTNRFAVRWTGQVESGVAGSYRFATISDAGVRLWVNNALVLDHWTTHSVTKHTSAPIMLAAGHKYNIKMEFYDNTGNAVAKLLWDPPNQNEAVIPRASLYSNTASAVPPSTYVSDLNPTFSQNSWGPYQRDRSNGETGRNDGGTISLGGIKFARGLGVHARSELRYALASKFKSFVTFVGVDDEVGSRGSVMFQVFVDGAKVFESPLLRGSDGPKPVEVNVDGKNELKLIVLGGEGNGYDHADWADARLLNGGAPAGMPPAAPAGLTALPGNQQVALSWTGSAGAAGYNVYRGTSANGEAPIPVMLNVQGTSAMNGGLTNGTMYFYRVAAVNANGMSEKSNEASAKPGAVATPQPPPAPTGLSAVPGNSQVSLTWTASAGATSYNLYRGTSSNGQAAGPVMTGIIGTSFTNVGLVNGTKYFFKVAAVNAIGTGERSNEANATPAGAMPPAPTGLSATPGDTQVKLTWAASAGATSYNVYRGTTANGQAAAPVMTGVSGTTAMNTGLTNGTKYFYKVAAVNSNGTGERSNEASATPSSALPPAPTGLSAAPGDTQVKLTWTASAGATSYNVYRGTTANGQAATAVMTGITDTSATNTGLTNGTKYFFKVAAVNASGTGERSNEANATPIGALPPAPTGLSATPGDKQAQLSWAASAGATTYNVYRGTSTNGQAATPVMTGITGTTATNTGLTNGTKYFYKVAAVNTSGTGDRSNEANATPAAPAPPPAPTGLTALPGDKQVILSWMASAGAATYNVYRGTTTNGQSSTPVMTGIAATTFTNTGLTNGTKYFYKVAAVSANGTGERSNEANAQPTAPGLLLTSAQKDAFRFLRQSTWGPTQALVDHVVQVGKSAFIDEQFAAAPSVYPDDLIDKPNMELVSERFFQNGLQGQDQLRQRVAWALSQIFVVSATKVDNTHAMVPYIRMLHARAFDNVKDIMKDVTLSPAMGEFLDMVNNKKAANGIMPNENYGRELLQLFTIGLVMLNDDGTQQVGPNGPIVTYDQTTVAELSRALTGWTYGDTVSGNPTRKNEPFYNGPMEPVASFHDAAQKTILGAVFPAGQSAQADLDQAMTVIFNHPNVGPFLVRELIQRLVTSNPSPAYIRDIVGVFNNNGQGVRGDLKAVVKAILLHAEAANGTPTSGKFSEPALFTLTLCRVLCTNVVDHPFLTDFSQDMGQRVWFAPSVFNYFSPNYRAGALFAPEMQIWSTATAMTRANFVASLVRGGFGSDVTLNLTPFSSVAADPNALLDTVDALVMGGTMSAPMRGAILTALNATTSTTERVRTSLYLAAVSMQYQVEH